MCAPKLLFFNEKKMRKIRMSFDIEKSNFGIFWQLAINPKLKIQSFPLILRQKLFLILYPPFENSTTGIAIVFISHPITQ